jgi:hypothetical protein
MSTTKNPPLQPARAPPRHGGGFPVHRTIVHRGAGCVRLIIAQRHAGKPAPTPHARRQDAHRTRDRDRSPCWRHPGDDTSRSECLAPTDVGALRVIADQPSLARAQADPSHGSARPPSSRRTSGRVSGRCLWRQSKAAHCNRAMRADQVGRGCLRLIGRHGHEQGLIGGGYDHRIRDR